MPTKLEKPLRREIEIQGKPFVVTLLPEGFKLVSKGRRKGLELQWEQLASGEAALAVALKASLNANLEPSAEQQPPRSRVKSKKLQRTH
jgi:hypothetical protein